MVERQDIDALLIGSLYGELSSADEARLQAHLESHPADRSALADLTHARQVVRESRLREAQVEPPQAISALLLQEAARRAPKPEPERGSWFQRFTRSFMMHPAMAAAAVFTLVAGVAGTMYVRKGDHFAAQSKAPESGAVMPAPEPVTAATPPPGASADQGAIEATGAGTADRRSAGSAYGVRLDDEIGGNTTLQTGDFADDAVGADKSALAFEGEKGAVPAEAVKTAKRTKAAPRLDVRTESASPKDLEEAPATRANKQKVASKADAADTGGGVAAEPSKPAQPARTTRAPVAPPPPPPPSAVAASKAEAKPVDPETAWAKAQHARLVASVRAGDCNGAADLALAIRDRASAYYAQHIASDRDVQRCKVYIAQRREKQEAERAQRARAKGTTADEAKAVEAAPATPATK